MRRFLVVASVNADRQWRLSEKLKPGGRHDCADVTTRIGGSGWYAANALRAAGHEVTLACLIGEDAIGRALLSVLARSGIGTGGVTRIPQGTQYDILVEPDGERTLICRRPPEARVAPTLPAQTGFDGAYVNTPVGLSALPCVRPGAPIVVQLPLRDGSGRTPGTHVVVSRSDVRERASALWTKAEATADGHLRGLVITNGPASLTLMTANGQTTVPAGPRAPDGSVTIGAGDTFAAHLLAELGGGATLEQAAASAARSASQWLATRTEPPAIEA